MYQPRTEGAAREASRAPTAMGEPMEAAFGGGRKRWEGKGWGEAGRVVRGRVLSRVGVVVVGGGGGEAPAGFSHGTCVRRPSPSPPLANAPPPFQSPAALHDEAAALTRLMAVPIVDVGMGGDAGGVGFNGETKNERRESGEREERLSARSTFPSPFPRPARALPFAHTPAAPYTHTHTRVAAMAYHPMMVRSRQREQGRA